MNDINLLKSLLTITICFIISNDVNLMQYLSVSVPPISSYLLFSLPLLSSNNQRLSSAFSESISIHIHIHICLLYVFY